MSKWTDKEWLLGRTEDQQARKAKAREDFKHLGDTGTRARKVGRTLTWLVTLPVLGFAVGGVVGLLVGLIIGGLVVMRPTIQS